MNILLRSTGLVIIGLYSITSSMAFILVIYDLDYIHEAVTANESWAYWLVAYGMTLPFVVLILSFWGER